jgi:signal transduction histidine kinase
MNLIDNAIFAMDQKGKLSIEVFVNNKDLKVRISDNGKGIPKEIIPRIFDPFFSTKKMGDGTGMGLDIASTIVKRHNGEIKVNSEPGNTEFTVCLPVQQTIKMMQTP